MTEYSLSPAFVVINYHSAHAPHKMTLPTLAWDPLGGTAGNGGYLAWNSTNRDADDMIKDLVNTLAYLVPTTSTFDDYQIYTKADENAPNILRASGALAIDGLSTTLYPPGTQMTWNFRTTGFHHAKLVLIDVVPPGDFAPTFTGDLSTAQVNVMSQLTDVANAWSARDNSRIDTLQRITWTLNDAIRQAYRLN